jgi:hypothetical protein
MCGFLTEQTSIDGASHDSIRRLRLNPRHSPR